MCKGHIGEVKVGVAMGWSWVSYQGEKGVGWRRLMGWEDIGIGSDNIEDNKIEKIERVVRETGRYMW